MQSTSYCEVIKDIQNPERRAWHENYHDNFYGFPLHNDNELFGRLVMEINQAGLSWETILKKEAAFRRDYDNFDVVKVAAYTEEDRERILRDAGVIRNKLKVNATIENAKSIEDIQAEYGSFEEWLNHHHPLTKEEWVKLFKSNFKFTGGEIVGEFLMSTGYLPGAHIEKCPVYKRVIEAGPAWLIEPR